MSRRTRRTLQKPATPQAQDSQTATSWVRNAFVLAIAAGALAPCSAPAATIAVSANCSLADAITSANLNSATGGCSAGSGADTLTLPAAADLVLTEELPKLISDITLEGNGATVRRDPTAPPFRIFSIGEVVNELLLPTVTIRNTTVSGGSAISTGSSAIPGYGGGLLVFGGHVTVTGCRVTANRGDFGGGLSSGLNGNNFATLDIVNSVVSGNQAGTGGGVNGNTFTTITGSTLSGNTALVGGGVARVASISDSVISGNRAIRGGGLSVKGTMTVTNSTISGNTAATFETNPGIGGGVHIDNDDLIRGTLNLIDSTVSGNTAAVGGGLYFGDQSVGGNLSRSIVAGNTDEGNGADEIAVNSLFDVQFTGGSNLFGHSGTTRDQAFKYFTPGPSDIVATSDGTQPTALSAILSPLANNGGPTETHALPANSPAIDAAGATCSSADQRGATRPQGAACDIGAFERVTVIEPAAGVIRFSVGIAGSYPVSESDRFARVTLTRSGGSDGAASVWIKTFDGGPFRNGQFAVAGADYTLISQVVSWDDGDAADKTVLIPITDDPINEGTELFTAALSNAIGASFGTGLGATFATVPISDNGDTGSRDLTPDRFRFTDLTGVSKNNSIISNFITVTGLGAGERAPLAVTGSATGYFLNGVLFLPFQRTTVKNGDRVALQMTSSSHGNRTRSTSLNINGVRDTWSIRTKRR
ncbi:MAG: choice-of-anchor Q domain-containing protein [Panacagrimonas sp.]